MNDESNAPPPASDAEPAASAAGTAAAAELGSNWRGKLRKWLTIGGVAAVFVPVLAFALWTVITLSWTYSTGDRAGYIQKFSKKGWLCPTWEGELSMVNLPGAAPERWMFTVRDDLVASSVRSAIGHKVALEYEEHRGVPSSCFGETQYFVVGVRRLAEP
jgi:hypothetical protein